MTDNKLISSYVNPVMELLKKGNGGKIVVGIADYGIIQGNEKVKKEFETAIRDYPKLFIRFHPELPRNNQKTIMVQNGKSGRKNADATNLFESGVPLSGFDMTLNDLMQMFYEKYGTN